MNQVHLYAKSHEARRISKRIQQLSWTLNKLEARFEIEDLKGDELLELFNAYIRIFQELSDITNELKNGQLTEQSK